MKKTLLIVLATVIVLSFTGAAMAQPHRGGYGGHRGGGHIGVGEALLVITGAALLSAIFQGVRNSASAEQVIVYQQPESNIAVETNEVPRYRVNSCFPEGKYLWNGAIVTDTYGQQIGSLPAGMKLNPGSCIRYR